MLMPDCQRQSMRALSLFVFACSTISRTWFLRMFIFRFFRFLVGLSRLSFFLSTGRSLWLRNSVTPERYLWADLRANPFPRSFSAPFPHPVEEAFQYRYLGPFPFLYVFPAVLGDLPHQLVPRNRPSQLSFANCRNRSKALLCDSWCFRSCFRGSPLPSDPWYRVHVVGLGIKK